MSAVRFHERSCQRKRRYFNEVDAMIAAHKRYADGETEKLRAYLCNLCDGWHLTKQPRVYVDAAQAHVHKWRLAGRTVRCCHLFTEGAIDPLHNFALSVGLRLNWFQEKPYPHYELLGIPARQRAIERGAIEVDSKEASRILRIASPSEST